jgi:uncharacterized protein with HEPN domain
MTHTRDVGGTFHGKTIEQIESYMSVSCDVLLTTVHWQDAVIRQLEIIGEATKRPFQDLRSRHHGIPWHHIAGLCEV